jgi:branched-chain amino acid transport system permease protein
MWGFYKETLSASMGADTIIVMFVAVIVGGLGSVGGCFIGAFLMGLAANYAGFLFPKIALVSNLIVMVAILLWRPAGLYSKSR